METQRYACVRVCVCASSVLGKAGTRARPSILLHPVRRATGFPDAGAAGVQRKDALRKGAACRGSRGRPEGAQRAPLSPAE